MHRYLLVIACLGAAVLSAAEHQGEVLFRGLPVPGATVTIARDGKTFAAVTDTRGFYSFPDLADGIWNIEVSMFGFEPIRREIVVAPDAPAARWELNMLPLERVRAQAQPSKAPVLLAARPERRSETPAVETPANDDLSERAADGFLISGSVSNAAASEFSQAPAFGNFRPGRRRLYNGGIGVMLGNSALDARPFSLTGQSMPKPDYSRVKGVANIGGPLRIPGLLENGPMVFAGYQWTRNNSATTASALMPGAAERAGIFATPVIDPLTGAPFPNAIPRDRISPQAEALLRFYPLPNAEGRAGYNYQAPILSPTHQDALQSRWAWMRGPRDQLFGSVNLQSTRADHNNVFSFLDRTSTLGINTGVNWSHRFNQRWFLNLGYQFSRFSTRVAPHFANREDVSGLAGISGNDRDPRNWGPPALDFSSGIAGLAAGISSFNRNQTSGVSGSLLWNQGAHNITFGGGFRRLGFNYLSQQNPRGAFTFTGFLTGSDVADFLLGIPATSSIAFGNADKYFRQAAYDAYINDDWRVIPQVTVNAGLRWEYAAPITELYGRLVNLNVAPGFASAEPVVDSLLQPFRHGLAPRIGIAWRPRAGSPLVVRAGYGIYYDTSVYPAIALRLAQQPPLSKTWSVQNSAAHPLTLADGFMASPSAFNTFAADPRFRPGYAQNWQASVQTDLPASLQMTASYLGIKGTHAMQAFLPNTFPAGAANPCPACPPGFAYLASGGNSSRQAAQMQLRRRLRGGFAATLEYTFSKSIDDAAVLGGRFGGGKNARGEDGAPSDVGGLAIAQNWLDLRSERGLSAFDQRHLLSLHVQYTTGVGTAGGTLLHGWKGALFKEWTFATQITAGSGLPQTPVYLAPVERTGVTGTLRPDYTGAPLYDAPPGLFLNPAAYTAPRPGQWGNAGRNSITGPAQFTLNASLGRTFRASDRLNLDLRVDAANALNHVNYTAWNTTVNGRQFGWPAAAGAMRSLETTLRLRF